MVEGRGSVAAVFRRLPQIFAGALCGIRSSGRIGPPEQMVEGHDIDLVGLEPVIALGSGRPPGGVGPTSGLVSVTWPGDRKAGAIEQR